ncbi:MAG TPA: GNAT family N-acetyltransferase [Fimbriimonadaceae bacterium]|nr:GNAT family N-acetyltransferase [Fimbriimonadaceae bacterium]
MSLRSEQLNITIGRATPQQSTVVATMVAELLAEIVEVTGAATFDFDAVTAATTARDMLEREKYFVFLAHSDADIALIAMYESHALYTTGAFGTIAELYVRPEYRSLGVGKELLNVARAFGLSRGWKRLEVTTPPLPQFDRALRFYEKEGFSTSGGRKLMVKL